MTRIDTTIAIDDALGRMKTQAERDRQTISALRERNAALIAENLAKSKEIVALRRKRSQQDTTALTRKSK